MRQVFFIVSLLWLDVCHVCRQIDPVRAAAVGKNLFTFISVASCPSHRSLLLHLARSADAKHYCFEPDAGHELWTQLVMKAKILRRDARHGAQWIDKRINIWRTFAEVTAADRQSVTVQRSPEIFNLFMNTKITITWGFSAAIRAHVCARL